MRSDLWEKSIGWVMSWQSNPPFFLFLCFANPVIQRSPKQVFFPSPPTHASSLKKHASSSQPSLCNSFPDLLLLARVPRRRRTSAAIEATTAAYRRNEAEENLLVRLSSAEAT
uniref:Uncharacterized protein n=2 Tax=Aegilops tauschii subsp. strangulata TaxID=200361 RepID=A0A453AVH5_AEGTS